MDVTGNSLSGYFEINQTPCRAGYGMKEQLAWMRELSRNAKQEALNGIARRAQEGTRMGRIETKEDAIVQIAIDKNKQWNPGTIIWKNIDPPIIKYHPGSGRFVDLSV